MFEQKTMEMALVQFLLAAILYKTNYAIDIIRQQESNMLKGHHFTMEFSSYMPQKGKTSKITQVLQTFLFPLFCVTRNQNHT